MANKKKFKKPIRKIFLLEKEDDDFVSDYSLARGTPDSDFYREAVTEKINRIKLEDTLKEN